MDGITLNKVGDSLAKGIFSESKTASAPSPAESGKVYEANYRKAFAVNPVLYWGENNKYPWDLDEVAKKCNTLEAGLMVLGDHMVGQGLYIYRDVVENGVKSTKEIIIPEIEEWLESSCFDTYYDAACREYLRWANIYPLYKMNKDRKIVQVDIESSMYSRLELPNPNTGRNENIYTSAQWVNGLTLKGSTIPANLKQWVAKYPLITEMGGVDTMTYAKNYFTFAQHITLYTSGKSYGRAPWHAAYENGWIAISISVPEIKKRLFEWSVTLNYVIYIHEDYWKNKYEGKWETMSTEEKEIKIKARQKEIESNLVGKDNAYKTIFSSMGTDDRGNPIMSLKIEVVDNKMREGNFIPDSQVADSQIMFSVAVDPGLLGLVVPGGKQGGGSGSNIREASLALNARLRPHKNKILKPFYMVKKFHGWDKSNPAGPNESRIKIGVRDYMINTLDGRAPAAGTEVTSA